MQYLKTDSELGYIEDYTEIELEKLENLRSSIVYFTFGDYDEFGNYVIENEVVDDLIAMEKYIVETDGNMEFCKSSLKLDKQVDFVISYEGNKVYLLLIEKLKDKTNPMIEEYNEYVLDEYVVNGLVDRNIIYTKWNVKPFGGYVLDIFSCEEDVLEKYFGIVSRFKYLLESNQQLLEEEEDVEDVEAEYFNEIMEVLKRYPELYDVVILKMSEFIAKNEELFDETKPWYISHMNQLLNYCVKSNIGILSEVKKVEFEIEQHQLMVGQNVRKSEVIATEKRDNGALFLKSSSEPKTISAVGASYMDAVKKINKVLKPENNSQEAKKTFTKKEIALIKIEKAGIKKIKENVKVKATIVENIVKAAKEAGKGGKPAGKADSKPAAKKTDAKKAASKPATKKPAAKKPAAKSAAKKAEVKKPAAKPAAKPADKKKADDAKKKAAEKKKKEALAKKKKQAADKKKKEDEKKKKMRDAYAASNAAVAATTLIPRVTQRVATPYTVVPVTPTPTTPTPVTPPPATPTPTTPPAGTVDPNKLVVPVNRNNENRGFAPYGRDTNFARDKNNNLEPNNKRNRGFNNNSDDNKNNIQYNNGGSRDYEDTLSTDSD